MRKRGRQFSTGVTIGIAVVLLAVGLGGGYVLGAYLTKTSATTIDITEAGSTLLEPMMDIWGPAYTSHVNSHVTLSPAGGGSGTGQSESEAGTIDIGASDAYTANNLGVVDVPVAISSQLVMYNLGSSFVGHHLNLNGTMLAEIYDGTITSWNAPLIQEANPGVTLPATTIVPVVRSDSSGDTYIFSAYCDIAYKGWLYGNSTKAFQTIAPANGFQSGNGNVGIINKLNNLTGGIGYVGVSYKTSALSAGKLAYAALGDNLANSAAGGNVTATPSDAKNFINWSAQNVSYDASLGLNELNYAADGLAVSLILGGSPAGPTTWSTGGGGTNPTSGDPSPYPITNLEYTLVKTAPKDATHQTYVVEFLQWAISYGNNATTYLDQVNFIALTPQLQGLDQLALSAVQIAP
ncbi:MAG TPA: substrate-binding domain-containing protein [Thermoplasmata archaeon]|nr:substrate-binding domain-containing protein [Thermoplasmata archaeon]